MSTAFSKLKLHGVLLVCSPKQDDPEGMTDANADAEAGTNDDKNTYNDYSAISASIFIQNSEAISQDITREV